MKAHFESWRNNVVDTIPKRLSDMTRNIAWRALEGEFGREMRNAEFKIASEGNNEKEKTAIYADAIMKIAETAPLRVIEGEKIIGSATLLEATIHKTPGTDFPSTSHTTIGFEPVLRTGYKGLRGQIEKRLADPNVDADSVWLLDAMLKCLDAAGLWHRRYLRFIDEYIEKSTGELKMYYSELRRSAENVPENPPRNFREAVQSLWFMYCFQRLCGNWSGVGRIDLMLGPYLSNDLKNNIISYEEAREILAHFWIKGCEWVGAGGFGFGTSGDAQFYQNIVLSGIDESGDDVTNEITYLVLDIIEELHISDFPVAVRINTRTPDRLLRRIAEVQRLGGGIVAIYNEDIVIKALTNAGYPVEEARNFSNDGCWETIIQGKTAFTYLPFDSLKILQDTIDDKVEPSDFDDLYEDYLSRLRNHVDEFNRRADRCFRQNTDIIPTPLLSMFVEGCVEKGRSYNNRGAKYNVVAIHAGGLPDVANNLFALKKMIFDDMEITWREFKRISRDDWRGHEKRRQQILDTLLLYGNDHDESDAMMTRVYDDYVEIASRTGERGGILRPVGISTFGREHNYAKERKATAFGRFAGEILASNLAPTPGTDKSGPTAVVKSFCKQDYTKLGNGVPLDLKILPASVKGEKGLANLISLTKTFMNLGGFYLQLDVVDAETLLDAQKHPEKYPNLSVRISGWSARFATLSKSWQDMVIQRTQQAL